MKNRIFEEDVKTIAEGIAPVAKKLSGTTILITGGAGFLGNYFLLTIDYLNRNVLDKPCRVISLDNFITGVSYKVAEGPNLKAIKHAVKNPIQIDEDDDYVIHLAGIASPRFYRKYKIETIDVGTLGTKNMLELAKEIISLTKSKSKIVFKELPVDDPKIRKPDITQAKNLLHWEPKIARKEGLRRTTEYFMKKLRIR